MTIISQCNRFGAKVFESNLFVMAKGVISGLGCVLTLGQMPNLITGYRIKMRAAKFILVHPYQKIFLALTGRKCFTDAFQAQHPLPFSHLIDCWSSWTNYECSQSSHFVIREIISRACVLIYATARVIARVVETSFAMLAIPVSCISFGHLPKIDHLAYKAFFVTLIVKDVMDGLVGFVKPNFNQHIIMITPFLNVDAFITSIYNPLKRGFEDL